MPALVSAINKAIPLRGVNTASFPALTGSVLYEREVKVTLPAAEAIPVTVIMRVVRSSFTRLLDFQYRLVLTETDYDDALRLQVVFPATGAILLFADFRLEAPGLMPPTYFESTTMEPAVFRFDYGLAVGRDSRFCFLSTNAAEFSESGGKVTLLLHNKKGVSVDGPAPLGPAVGRFMAPVVVKVDTDGESSRSIYTTNEYGDPSLRSRMTLFE